MRLSGVMFHLLQNRGFLHQNENRFGARFYMGLAGVLLHLHQNTKISIYILIEKNI